MRTGILAGATDDDVRPIPPVAIYCFDRTGLPAKFGALPESLGDRATDRIMGLRAKVNLVLLAASAVGLAIGCIVLYQVSVANARARVLQNARIMMTAANAIRSYTADELVRLLPTERDGKFVAETVPDFAAKTALRDVQAAFPGYNYREPTLNPTAQSDRAVGWEADIIGTFRAHADDRELVIERDTPLGPTLNLARPITVNDAACFRCHSFPAAAPAALTASYGTSNGFGWKFNETVGAQLISLPMAAALKVAQDAFVAFLIILIVIFGLVFAILNVLLHYLVIAPVKRVSAIAEAISLGEEGIEFHVKPGKDEIASLSQSFNRMRESLTHATTMMTR
jgi:HAMP domain-containing protein